LANIEFTALVSGAPPLTLSNVFLNLSNQGFEIGNGAITVTPEPGSLVLLAGGLAFLAAGRRLARPRRRDGF
jgi:hypothetical protein